MDAKLFPYVLNRVCTVSYELIDKLNKDDNDFEKLIDDYDQFGRQLIFQKDQLSAQLYDAIGLHANIEEADQLKFFRRELYNQRIRTIPEIIRGLLNSEMIHNIESHFRMITAKESLYRKYTDVYYEDFAIKRKKMQRIISSNVVLQKGLILSSKQLFIEIDKYSKLAPVDFKKKENNAELSFLKYLSRMCCKTSPFSTFTSLSISNIEDSVDHIDTRSNNIQGIRSHIRLNNQIFRYIKGLLSSYKSFRLHLFVELNSTINEQATLYEYIINHNNIESIQQISKTEILGALIACYTKWKRPVTFLHLIKTIIGLTGVDKNAAEGFLYKLIENGFLNFDFQISGLDPNWDINFVKKLKRFEQLGVAGVKELILSLKILIKNGKKYEKANVNGRLLILEESFLTFRSTCEHLYRLADLPKVGLRSFGIEVEVELPNESKSVENKADMDNNSGAFKKMEIFYFTFKPEQIYYEDTTTAISFTFPSVAIQELARDINNLHGQVTALNFDSTFKSFAKKLYLSKEQDHRGEFPFLSFYREFYKKYVSISDVKIDPGKIQRKVDKLLWVKKLSKLPKSELLVNNNQDECQLNQFFSSNRNEKGVNGSHSIFVQPFYNDKEELEFVINGTMAGYGKWIGRFLHLFDEKITEVLRQMNMYSYSDEMLFENTDSSFFNANIHPVLMPYESRIPGGNNHLPKHKQISVSDILVEYNEEAQQLILVHKTLKRKILAFDLCFQGIIGRSNLYQLLNKFSPVKEYGLPYINSEFNKKVRANYNNQIFVFPRLKINNLIIQRKYWIIPSDQIPIKTREESQADYFLRVNVWRRNNGIPTEIFLRLTERKLNLKSKGKAGKDDYKPQYICFSNPLFVLLFDKVVKKSDKHIKIEEMLPTSKDLLKNNDKRYVSEFLIQWYNQ